MKYCGIIATCGYDLEYGISPFEDGIKRFREHFKIKYIGKAAVQRNAGDGVDKFQKRLLLILLSILFNDVNYLGKVIKAT